MEKPVDRIRGILDPVIVFAAGGFPTTGFLCGFWGFRINDFAIGSHGFIDQFTKNCCAWFVVTTLGLKPSVRFWTDIDYDLGHGIALVCPDSVS